MSDSQERLDSLRTQLDAEVNALREAELALRSAYASGSPTDTLTGAVASGRVKVESMRGALHDLEVAVAESRSLQRQVEATERLLKAIPRAYGSIVTELSSDETRLMEAATAFADAVQRVNSRYESLRRLRIEAEELSRTFGLPTPELVKVSAPALRPRAQAALRKAEDARLLETRSAWRRPEQRLELIADTVGGKLVAEVTAARPEAEAKPERKGQSWIEAQAAEIAALASLPSGSLRG